MRRLLFACLACSFTTAAFAQPADYAQKKAAKLAAPSPFEAIIAGRTDTKIIYRDADCVAFAPLRKQAPVHVLIVPVKRIATLNDATEQATRVLGHLMVVAKQLAKDLGIAESGYRLALNTNEDAGQTVFHIHVHLLGGMNLGPMLPQTYVDPAARTEK